MGCCNEKPAKIKQFDAKKELLSLRDPFLQVQESPPATREAMAEQIVSERAAQHGIAVEDFYTALAEEDSLNTVMMTVIKQHCVTWELRRQAKLMQQAKQPGLHRISSDRLPEKLHGLNLPAACVIAGCKYHPHLNGCYLRSKTIVNCRHLWILQPSEKSRQAPESERSSASSAAGSTVGSSVAGSAVQSSSRAGNKSFGLYLSRSGNWAIADEVVARGTVLGVCRRPAREPPTRRSVAADRVST